MSLFSSLTPPAKRADEFAGLGYIQSLRVNQPSLHGLGPAQKKSIDANATHQANSNNQSAPVAVQEEVTRLRAEIAKWKEKHQGLNHKTIAQQKSIPTIQPNAAGTSTNADSNVGISPIVVPLGVLDGSSSSGDLAASSTTVVDALVQQLSPHTPHTPSGTTGASMEGLSGWDASGSSSKAEGHLASLLNPSASIPGSETHQPTPSPLSKRRTARMSLVKELRLGAAAVSAAAPGGGPVPPVPSQPQAGIPSFAAALTARSKPASRERPPVVDGSQTERVGRGKQVEEEKHAPPIQPSSLLFPSIGGPPRRAQMIHNAAMGLGTLPNASNNHTVTTSRTLEDELLELERERRQRVKEQKARELGWSDGQSRIGTAVAGGRMMHEEKKDQSGIQFPSISGSGSPTTTTSKHRPSDSFDSSASPALQALLPFIHASGGGGTAGKGSGWESSTVLIDLQSHYAMFEDKISDYTHRLTKQLQKNLDRIRKKIYQNEFLSLQATKQRLRELLRFYHTHEGSIYDSTTQIKDSDRTLKLLELEEEELIKQQQLIQEDWTQQSGKFTQELFQLHSSQHSKHGTGGQKHEYLHSHSKTADAQVSRLQSSSSSSRRGSKGATSGTPQPNLPSLPPSQANSRAHSLSTNNSTSVSPLPPGPSDSIPSAAAAAAATTGGGALSDSSRDGPLVVDSSSRRSSRRNSQNDPTLPAAAAAAGSPGAMLNSPPSRPTSSISPSSSSSQPTSTSRTGQRRNSKDHTTVVEHSSSSRTGQRRNSKGGYVQQPEPPGPMAEQDLESKISLLRTHWQELFASTRQERSILKQLKSELLSLEKSSGMKLEIERMKVEGLEHKLSQVKINREEILSSRSKELQRLREEHGRIDSLHHHLEHEHSSLTHAIQENQDTEDALYTQISKHIQQRLEIQTANQDITRELERQYYESLKKRYDSAVEALNDFSGISKIFSQVLICPSCSYEITSSSLIWSTGETECEKCAFQHLFPANFQAVVKAIHKQLSQAHLANSLSSGKLKQVGDSTSQATSSMNSPERTRSSSPASSGSPLTSGLSSGDALPSTNPGGSPISSTQGLGDLGARLLSHLSTPAGSEHSVRGESPVGGSNHPNQLSVSVTARAKRGSLGGLVEAFQASFPSAVDHSVALSASPLPSHAPTTEVVSTSVFPADSSLPSVTSISSSASSLSSTTLVSPRTALPPRQLQELSEWNVTARPGQPGFSDGNTLLWMKNRLVDLWRTRFLAYKLELEDLTLNGQLLPAMMKQFQEQMVHSSGSGKNNE